MLPDRRTHRRIGQASASPPAESSPYRRSQHTFVSGPQILLALRAPLVESRPRSRASPKQRRESLPATSIPTPPSAHTPIWPQPSSFHARPCRAARAEPVRPEPASLPRARPPRSTGSRPRPQRSLRKKPPRFASQNPPAAVRQRQDAYGNRRNPGGQLSPRNQSQ